MNVDAKTVITAAALAIQLAPYVVGLVRTNPEVARREELRRELEELRESRREVERRREEVNDRMREAMEAELSQVNAVVGKLEEQLEQLDREMENEETERRNRQQNETAEELEVMEEHLQEVEDLNNKFDERAGNLEENHQKLRQEEVENHQKRKEMMGIELEKIREEGKQIMERMKEENEQVHETRIVLLTEHSKRLEASANILNERVIKETELVEKRKSKLHAERKTRYKARHDEQIKQMNENFAKLMEHHKEESSRELMENTEKWMIEPVTNLCEALSELNFEIQRVEKGTRAEDWNFKAANNKVQDLLEGLKYKKSMLHRFIRNASNGDADQNLKKLVNKLNQNIGGVLLSNVMNIPKYVNLAIETENYDGLTKIKDDIMKLEQNIHMSIENFQMEALN